MDKQQVAEIVVALKDDPNFVSFLNLLIEYRQDYFNRLLSVKRTIPEYQLEMAWQQGRIAGLDTIFRIVEESKRILQFIESKKAVESL